MLKEHPNGSAARPCPCHYTLKLEGYLDSGWSEWLEGMEIDYKDGVTRLHGPLTDQCALHGLLIKIRDLNLALIELHRDTSPDDSPCCMKASCMVDTGEADTPHVIC